MINSWYSMTVTALQEFWQGFLNFIPALIGAIIAFIIGWIISSWIGRLVAAILKKLKFDRIFESKGWKNALNKADIGVNPSEFIGAIVKWILVIVSLLVAVDILGLEQFGVFLKQIIAYLPNVLAAVLIFVVTVILADIAKKIVIASVGGIKVTYSHLVGEGAKWIIWIFGIFAILTQLNIARSLIITLFQGLVIAFSLAIGLAFGLGGKDVAADFLGGLKKRFKEKNE